MKNVFNAAETTELIKRINNLKPDSKANWGKMSVAQMLAHCNVTYEMAFEDKHTKPNAFKRFLLKLLVKPIVVNEKPYKKSSHTAPEFIIKEDKDFEKEKTRLINYLQKTQQLGSTHFEGKESHSFGPLTSSE